MNAAKLHVIYSLLLAHLLTLSPEDEQTINKYWQCVIYGEDIAWPRTALREMSITELAAPSRHPAPLPVKICSAPSEPQMLAAAEELSTLFDLNGVPGFYREEMLPGPGKNDLRNQIISDYGPWRIRLPQSGLIVPYTNGGSLITGLQLYRSVRDRKPFLLSSRGLPGGARAIAVAA